MDWTGDFGIITTDPYRLEPLNNRYNPLADGALLQFPDGKLSTLCVSRGFKGEGAFLEKLFFRPEIGKWPRKEGYTILTEPWKEQ